MVHIVIDKKGRSMFQLLTVYRTYIGLYRSRKPMITITASKIHPFGLLRSTRTVGSNVTVLLPSGIQLTTTRCWD